MFMYICYSVHDPVRLRLTVLLIKDILGGTISNTESLFIQNIGTYN